jgi:hypothetical protein
MTTENSTPRSYPEFNDMTFDQLRLVLDGAADRAMQVVKSIDLFWEKFPNEMQPLLKDWKEHCQIIGYSTDSHGERRRCGFNRGVGRCWSMSRGADAAVKLQRHNNSSFFSRTSGGRLLASELNELRGVAKRNRGTNRGTKSHLKNE